MTILDADASFCVVIPEFLSAQECREHIARSEARGFGAAASHYPPSYRNNDRQVVDDPAFARQMAERLLGHVPEQLQQGGERWAFDGVNERFRFCRYRAGQQFNLHQDGVHHRGPGVQSRLTFMVYLTDGEAFDGGDTLFYSAGPAGDANGAPAQLIGRVRPRAGSLILFDHSLWHAGETVTRGVKHILRSDVLYRRLDTAPAPCTHPFEPGHQGYVWALARLGDDLLASGGRDTTIRLWHDCGRPAGQLAGHRQSVLGLAALPGSRLASISRDGDLRLWSLADRSCLHTAAAHEGSGLSVAGLPDGTLATGGADGLVRLWQTDGAPLATLRGHTGWVWSVAALGDEHLASASEDGTAKLWARASGRCVGTLAGASPLRDLLVLPGSERLVCADIDGRLTTWARSGNTWAQTHTMQAHGAAVRRLRWLGDGVFASAGEDNRVRLWHLASHTLLTESRHENFVTDVLPLPGAYLSCSYDGRIARHARHARPEVPA
jgi:predicted 2-oxoglutarate/Fe(II)-dependent dioxygenase YbiX